MRSHFRRNASEEIFRYWPSLADICMEDIRIGMVDAEVIYAMHKAVRAYEKLGKG